MTSSLVRLLTLLPSLGDLPAPLLACRFSLNLIDCLGPSLDGARILVRHILLTWHGHFRQLPHIRERFIIFPSAKVFFGPFKGFLQPNDPWVWTQSRFLPISPIGLQQLTLLLSFMLEDELRPCQLSFASIYYISYKPSSCCCTSSRRLSSKEIWKFWTMFLQCVPGRWRRWEFPRGHRWWWQAEKIFITSVTVWSTSLSQNHRRLIISCVGEKSTLWHSAFC